VAASASPSPTSTRLFFSGVPAWKVEGIAAEATAAMPATSPSASSARARCRAPIRTRSQENGRERSALGANRNGYRRLGAQHTGGSQNQTVGTDHRGSDPHLSLRSLRARAAGPRVRERERRGRGRTRRDKLRKSLVVLESRGRRTINAIGRGGVPARAVFGEPLDT
jgi:hypothetical protein